MTESKLAPQIETGLDSFCLQAREALGDNLLAIVLYGDALKGRGHQIAVEVMLILVRPTALALDALAEPVRQGMQDFRLSVMLVSPEDLQTSTDVFPIKFRDMQRHHRLLWGQDLLGTLVVEREHLRLRCEQEFKNLLLRLRRQYLQFCRQPADYEAVLKSSLTPCLLTLATLIELRGDAEADAANPADLLARAQRVLDLDISALTRLVALKAEKASQDAAGLKTLYADFLHTVERLSLLADRLEA